MIMPHQSDHVIARDGSLLRVDVMAGRSVTTRYTPNPVIAQRVVGTERVGAPPGRAVVVMDARSLRHSAATLRAHLLPGDGYRAAAAS
jgi:hypothetical protein